MSLRAVHEFSKKVFDSCKTLEDYHRYYQGVVNDEYFYNSPNASKDGKTGGYWYTNSGRLNCYEEGDNIHFYLNEFNKNGFMTFLSQPSLKVTNPTKADQRAMVAGVLTHERAMLLFYYLENDPRIMIAVTNLNDNTCYYNYDSSIDHHSTLINDKPYSWFHSKVQHSADIKVIETERLLCEEMAPNYEDKNRMAVVRVMDSEFGNDDEYVFSRILEIIKL